MRDAGGRVARVSGACSGQVVPTARDSNMICVLRGTKGASQGDYCDSRHAYKAGRRSAVETFEDDDNGGHETFNAKSEPNPPRRVAQGQPVQT